MWLKTFKKIWPNFSIKISKIIITRGWKLKMHQKCSMAYLLTWLWAPYTFYTCFFLSFFPTLYCVNCEFVFRVWNHTTAPATMEYLPILLGKYAFIVNQVHNNLVITFGVLDKNVISQPCTATKRPRDHIPWDRVQYFMRPRSRPTAIRSSPKKWSRDHAGLETLTPW